MKQTTYPLEQELGIQYYASDAEGIGGCLRSTPEDFIVEEIPQKDRGGTEGPYLICILTKQNWELQHAVKEIAKRLGISHRRIGWAGTKDRNAITKQWISIYDVTAHQVNAIRLKDISLQPVAQSNLALSLGDLEGNRFDIVIRDAEGASLEAQVAAINETARNGVPNYFGIQRFGAIRPVTHQVGKCMLKGDYEQAVLTYIGLAFPDEPEDIRKIRKDFLATRDPRPAIDNLPPQMNYERAMLHYLYSHPGEYGDALKELPPKLLSMFVSAFQSWIFNLGLSRRFDDGLGLDEPVPGDRLIFANGRTDIVTAANKTAVSLHLARGRCSIALFMPGRDLFDAQSDGEQITEALLADQGICAEDFARASSFVRTKFEGTYRPISLKTAIESSISSQDVRLKFTLPPGHYATTVCREFMKADPVKMI
jgi:tRNA pseudouridine13 synthase